MTGNKLAVPVAAALAAAGAACSDAAWEDLPPIEPGTFAAQHEEWRADRERSLKNPDAGVISWIGLWELAEGANPFGSEPALAIVLPVEDSPPVAGSLRLEGGQATLEPAARSGLTNSAGEPVTAPLPLRDDRSDSTTVLKLGSLGLRVHAERGTDRLWLRVWDTDAPRVAAFGLPPYFEVSSDWRVRARFEAYAEPRSVELADVTGGTVANVAPGELVFRAGGREHRLVAFATASSSNYFVSLWDSTGVADTYQGGRYMRVPFADEDGWTVIDFNRAYNPPCVFTPYSVCSLPPRENRLELAVTAGERRPARPAY